MRIIEGTLARTDLGEFDGKIYGDIVVKTKEGNRTIKYPLGTQIELPVIGSYVVVHYSDDSQNNLESIKLIEKVPVEKPNVVLPVDRPIIGISKRPSDWIFAAAIVYLGVQLGYVGFFLMRFTYSPDWINSLRNQYIVITIAVAFVSVVVGISMVITKHPLANLASLMFGLIVTIFLSIYWQNLSDSYLLMYDEEQLAAVYANATDFVLLGLIVWIVLYSLYNIFKKD